MSAQRHSQPTPPLLYCSHFWLLWCTDSDFFSVSWEEAKPELSSEKKNASVEMARMPLQNLILLNTISTIQVCVDCRQLVVHADWKYYGE